MVQDPPADRDGEGVARPRCPCGNLAPYRQPARCTSLGGTVSVL